MDARVQKHNYLQHVQKNQKKKEKEAKETSPGKFRERRPKRAHRWKGTLWDWKSGKPSIVVNPRGEKRRGS